MDKLTILNNLKILAKAKNIPMNELELAMGVSTGYVARLVADITNFRERHPDKPTVIIPYIEKVKKELNEETERPLPPAEALLRASLKLDISIDLISSIDFSQVENLELLIISFLDSLTRETEKNKLIWVKEEKLGDDNPYEGFKRHPLSYITTEEVYDPATGEPTDMEFLHFNSLFREDDPELCGDLLKLDNKNKILFLAEVNHHDGHQNHASYELYALQSGKIIKIADCFESYSTKSPTEIAFEKLYKAAKKSRKLNPNGDDIAELLNGMMKDFGFKN